MTANTVAAETAFAPASAADEGRVELETRFGLMSFDRAGAIFMPRGLLGYSEHHDFALANLPDPRLAQFKLLQCLSQPTLSFVVAPANMDGDAIDRADLDAACRSLGIEGSEIAALLVVATRKIGPATQISVNLRAPVILDLHKQMAWQFVLGNNRYPVRHVIGTIPAAPMTASTKAG